MSSEKDGNRPPRTVEVVDSSYQPSKAELEADVSINATPDDVARALTRTVNVRRVKTPRSKAASVKSGKPARK